MILFLPLFTWSQTVKVDQMESDGRHQIMTNLKNFSIEGLDYSMTLKAYESTDSLDWRLTVSTFNTIPNDNVVLLKLKNGQIITLHVDSLHEESYTTSSVTYNSQYVGITQPGITKTYWVSESQIKVGDLDDIEAHGISKIRIGNNVKYIEERWTNNPLGKFLSKCRKKISERLQHSKGQKKNNGSVYDGFSQLFFSV